MTAAALAAVLLGGLVRGMALAAVVALLLRVAPRVAPPVRALLWWLAIAGAVAASLPVRGLASVAFEGRGAGAVEEARRAAVNARAEDGGAPAIDGAGEDAGAALGSAPRRHASVVVADGPPAPRDIPAAPVAGPDVESRDGARIILPSGAWPLAFLAIVLGGALLALARIARQLARVVALKRDARPLDAALLLAVGPIDSWTRRPVRLARSAAIASPITLGYRTPMVLLPDDLLARLTPTELRHTVCHELAHVRRHDDWALLAQRLIEAVFWYHPAVRWAARRLDVERELACDAAVARAAGGRHAYARSLLRLAELRLAPAPALTPGVASRRSHLAHRVEALLTVERPGRTMLAGMLACGGAAAAVWGVAHAPPIEVHRAASPTGATASQPEAERFALVPQRIERGLVRGPLGVRLDSALARFADSGFSGTVLVARGDEIVLEKGYGLADRTRELPTTAETRYSVAGVTKAFTAAAILRLEEEGRLAVTDSLARFLGPLPDGMGDVTLHQLLTYTDGLARQSAPVFRPSRGAFLAVLARTPRHSAPGAAYRYNDFGHSVLAAVIERVTGERYETHIRRRFLAPLGLAETTFEPDADATSLALAVEYEGPRDRQTAVPHRGYLWGRVGSLGMVSTAGDLYRWWRAFAEGRVVSDATRRRMLDPQATATERTLPGYGWGLLDVGEPRPLIRRVAGTPGFEGEILYDPNNDWMAIILVNSRLGWRFRVWDEIASTMRRGA